MTLGAGRKTILTDMQVNAMTTPIYYIKTEGLPDTFSITNYRPEGADAPKTQGWVRYIPGTGLEVTMRCYETDPRAVYREPDAPVFNDSCMEVFLNCFPELPEYGYINVEMNAAGFARCGFGKDRATRRKLLEMGIPQPRVEVIQNADHWQVQCLLSEGLLETLYERPCHFAPGHEMRGNFYKCAEEVQPPHWASWAKVERLDFHTPEYFGVLRIV